MTDRPSDADLRGLLRFGVFELDLRTGELRKAGSRVRLAGQPLRVLERLVERPGDLVTRDELRHELWSDDTFVDFERNLNSAIKRLRGALGDSADSPRFIETLPRRGYRFLVPVQRIAVPFEAALGFPPAASTDGALDDQPAPGEHRALRSWRPGKRLVPWLVAATALGAFAVGLTRIPWRQRPPVYRTIAVLPFVLAAHAAEDEYLAFGLSEALITELSKQGSLQVISQTSSMQYKNTDKALPRIAEELGVDVVVEGSVQREGTRLRITAQLIEAATDSHLWAETYEREIGSFLTVADEVAREVAKQVHVTVAPADAGRSSASRPVDTAVAEAYLKGRYLLGRGTEADARRAVSYFERALALDASHARSHSGLADYYTVTDALAPEVAAERARFHAERALELDGNLPDAHTSLAFLHFYYDWDWSGAEKEFRRAIELDPGHVRAHRWFGLFLSAMGRHAEALVQIEAALAADPIAVVNHDAAGTVRFNARQYAETTTVGRSILELNAFDARGYEHVAAGAFQLGRHADALAQAEKGLKLAGSNLALELVRVLSLNREGRIADAEKAVADLEHRAEHQYVSPVLLALDHAHLGRESRALDYLDQAYASRDAYLVLLDVSPWFDPLRVLPRFQRLCDHLSFPDAPSPSSSRPAAQLRDRRR
jgi:TolB-like protein/DNA-binding winged helix-turn-helix (wHTH) protein/Tfp pilus assembly protein PilF